MNELFEKLAAIEHERWASWQAYMFSKCLRVENQDGKRMSLVIPGELVDQWERQLLTSYADLTDEEKESDRDQVRRYWHLISGEAGD